MTELIAIKKSLPNRSITAFAKEDNKNITINISQTDYESQYKKAEKRLNDIISALFEEAIKAEEKIISEENVERTVALTHEARSLVRVIKLSGLWDGYLKFKEEAGL